MTTPAQLPVLSQADATFRARELREKGARILLGAFVDSAGVLRAKQVSIDRAPVFHSPGLGASPVWVIFCVDDAIALEHGPVGDDPRILSALDLDDHVLATDQR